MSVRKLNLKNVKRKQEELQQRGGGGGGQAHKLPFDKTVWFFIMPPWSDADEIWLEIWKHGFRGGNCPESAKLRRCPLCAELKRRKAMGDEEFDKNYYLQPQSFVNALLVSDVKKNDPSLIKVLRMPKKMFNQLLDFILEGPEEDGTVTDISDVQQAYKIGIKKFKNASGDTRYNDLRFGDRSADISNFVTPKFLQAGLVNLDTYRWSQPASDKDLRSVFQGQGGDDDFTQGKDDQSFMGSSGEDFSDDFAEGGQEEDDVFSGTGTGGDDFSDDFSGGLDDDDLDLGDDLQEVYVIDQILKQLSAAQNMGDLQEAWTFFRNEKANNMLSEDEIKQVVQAKNEKKASFKGRPRPKRKS